MRLLSRLFIFCLVVTLAGRSSAFTEVSAGLHPVSLGAAAWGDYDGDGDLDLALTGQESSGAAVLFLYRNDGQGSFRKINPGLTGVFRAAMAWGDYDNDGDLDLAYTGRSFDTQSVTRLARNNGDGTFTEINPGLASVTDGSLTWADADTDGDIDLLIIGERLGGLPPITHLYQNNGNGNFTISNAIENYGGKAAWGDYNGDGALDLALGGQYVLRNNGSAPFSVAVFPGHATTMSVAWSDYDNDGDLDLAFAGRSYGQRVTRISRNNGDGTFLTLDLGLPALEYAALAWADYDNDGDSDLVLSGSTVDATVTRLCRNNGDGTFAVPDDGIPGVNFGALAWGDYDNDGDVDLVIAGRTRVGELLTKLYRNDTAASNLAPAIPPNTSSVVNSSGVTLSWDAPGDDHTPASVLTYNLRLGTAPGTSDVWASHADLSTGFRRLPAMGNLQAGTTMPINAAQLKGNTTYHWSVQAVDGSFRGGGFSVESSFTTPIYAPLVRTDPADSITGTSAVVKAAVNPHGGVTTAHFEYGTTFPLENVTPIQNLAAENLEVAVTASLPGLVPGTTYYYRIVAQNTGGTVTGSLLKLSTPLFTEQATTLTAVSQGGLAWGDYDNDGDLDLAFGGAGEWEPVLRIARNDGAGVFSEIDPGLTAVTLGALGWADYDNDGDIDLAWTGTTSGRSSGAITKIGRNNGDGTFTELNAGLPGMWQSSLAWGDYDNDGFVDLALSGVTTSFTEASFLCRNNGDGTFSRTTIPAFPAVVTGGLAWGDYDADGDLDLAYAGGGSAKQGGILVNRGNGTFTGFVTDQVSKGAVAWGDMDNDGDLDLMQSGEKASPYGVANIYRTTAGRTVSVFNFVAKTSNGSVAWGDLDNDGDVDLVLAGFHGDDTNRFRTFRAYRNNGTGALTEMVLGLTGADECSLALGDFDGDSRLDVALAGATGQGWTEPTGRFTKIFRNADVAVKVTPGAPSALVQSASDGNYLFSWSAPADSMTPSAGLSYELRIGTTPGGSQIVSSSSATNGQGRVALRGRIQRSEWTLKKALPPGDYYWSVQAVDSGLARSAFAPEQKFTIFSNPLEAWRSQWFGVTTNTGNAADSADPDLDGSLNFVEFALTTDPTSANSSPTLAGGREGNNFTFTYTRRKTAASVITFVVEWTSDFTSWNREGVSERIHLDDGNVEVVKASVGVGVASKIFFRLRLTRH